MIFAGSRQLNLVVTRASPATLDARGFDVRFSVFDSSHGHKITNHVPCSLQSTPNLCNVLSQKALNHFSPPPPPANRVAIDGYHCHFPTDCGYSSAWSNHHYAQLDLPVPPSTGATFYHSSFHLIILGSCPSYPL